MSKTKAKAPKCPTWARTDKILDAVFSLEIGQTEDRQSRSGAPIELGGKSYPVDCFELVFTDSDGHDIRLAGVLPEAGEDFDPEVAVPLGPFEDAPTAWEVIDKMAPGARPIQVRMQLELIYE